MKIKIVEFSSSGPGIFISFLKFLSQKKAWDFTFVHSEHYDASLLEGAAAAKVEMGLSSQILPTLKVSTTLVRSTEVLDSFFYDEGAWYPRLLLHEVLRQVLISDAKDLDIRAPGFVVGDREVARVAASVLAALGMGQIFLVGDAMALLSQKIVLARSQLGINFEILPRDELTMQSVSAAIIINTEDLSDNPGLLTDLSYFNFMEPSGYALDLNEMPVDQLLLEEARNAELRVLTSAHILQELALEWLRRLKVSPMLSKEEIYQMWELFLKENPSSV